MIEKILEGLLFGVGTGMGLYAAALIIDFIQDALA